MSTQTMTAAQPRTVLDVLQDLWRAKAFIVTGLALGVLAACIFINTATPHYRAQMMISPANPMSGTDVSSLAGGDSLFALSYLVQRMGVNNSSDFMRFENTYAGPSVAELLLKDPKIIDGLVADKTFEFSQPQRAWNASDLSEYIGKRVRLDPVGSSSLRRMSYMHPSRDFAVYFLQNLHRITDELIRQKIRQDAAQRVQYLQKTIDNNNNPEHKRNLTALLMEQERLLMLVSIETAYAASVVEPPAASTKAYWPDAMLVFPACVLAGAVTGFAVFMLRMALGQNRQQRRPGPKSMRRAKWFKKTPGNKNEKPLTGRQAAE